MRRYIVTFVSVGANGATSRPAVFDTVDSETVKVYRRGELYLADDHAARLNRAAQREGKSA